MEHTVGTLRDKARVALAARRRQSNLRPVITTTGCGFVAGTRVATPGGWATVDSLHVGDEVLTFDAGFQRIMAMVFDPIFSHDHVTPRNLWPVFVPAGALENRRDLLVQPGEGVLVESPTVRDKWGDPYAVIPGAALDVIDGTYRVEPATPLNAILPVFSEDQMVFVNGGALLFSQCIWGVRAGVRPRFGTAANYNMVPVQRAMTMLETGAVRNVSVKPEMMLAAA
ncbi:MAG: Hint domain-containing protein [Shimia sp.]